VRHLVRITGETPTTPGGEETEMSAPTPRTHRTVAAALVALAAAVAIALGAGVVDAADGPESAATAIEYGLIA
jgi:ferric-dicitrate binding protein FerR (iron transport regulator)